VAARAARPVNRGGEGVPRRVAFLPSAGHGPSRQRRQQCRVRTPAGRPGEGVASGRDWPGEQPSHERGSGARPRLVTELEQRRGQRGRRVGLGGQVEQVSVHAGDGRVRGCRDREREQGRVGPRQAERGDQVLEAGITGSFGERRELRGHRRRALIRAVEGLLRVGHLGWRREGPVYLAVTDRQLRIAVGARLRPQVPQPEHPAGGSQPDLGEPAWLGRDSAGAGVCLRPCRCRVHGLTHTAGSDSTPFTRTRTGRTVPAVPGGGEKENEPPAGPILTSPGAGDAVVSVSAAVPTSTSVAPRTKPVPVTVNGGAPVSTVPAGGLASGGFTLAAMLTGVEPLRVPPGGPSVPLPTRS
jgi:hypothetical protein